VFLAGEIPVLARVKPAHQESSLRPMEVTTWVKRRQSDFQAVTQVKQFSPVNYDNSRADKVCNLEGYSRQPLRGQGLPETSTGSVSMA
jgi:hypothetical protein